MVGGRRGDKTILFARFISGLRVVAALFAGLSGMRWRTFALYNAAGAIVWAMGMSLLGFFFGESWSLLEKWVGLGGLIALGVVGLAVVLVISLHHARALLRRGARREAEALAVAAGTAEAVTLILLYTVQRARPGLWEALVHLHRFSFPSAHATVSTATYGMVAYLLGHRWPAFKRLAQVGASLLILAIGISRVALGASWPTGVLGGFAGGLLILWATIYWYEGNYGVILQAIALIARRSPAQREGAEATPPGESEEGRGALSGRDDARH